MGDQPVYPADARIMDHDLETQLLNLYLPIRDRLATKQQAIIDRALYCGSDLEIEDAIELCRMEIDALQRRHAEKEA